MTTETETKNEPMVTISARQTVTYEGLTIQSLEPLSQRDLINKLQNLIVALVDAQLGKVKAMEAANEQGEQAAEMILSDNLREAASQLGLRDRRQAPMRTVTWANGRSRKEKLSCGHTFVRPTGHARAKRRRCVECVAWEATTQK